MATKPTTPGTEREKPEFEIGVAGSDEEFAAGLSTRSVSFGEYVRDRWQHIRNGEGGMLPVIGGLIVICIFFELERSVFLSDRDLVNMFNEASEYILLGAAEIFILLLSEIDLSLGYGAGVGALVMAELAATPVGLPWWVAVMGGMAAIGAFGAVQGALVAWVRLPSFIVTLGGELALLGLLVVVADVDPTAVGGTMEVSQSNPVYGLVNSAMGPTTSWIVMGCSVVAFGTYAVTTNRARHARGLTSAPLISVLVTTAAVAIGGIVLVFVCNGNTPKGVPWTVPLVILVIVLYTWLLGRTRFGRYIYAVGANPEAARRAGINVKRVLVGAFAMAGITTVLSGLVIASSQGSVSTDLEGGQLVLFAVAVAVIGGTSLFGGRGKMVHALLGGVVIAVVFNGLALMGVDAAVQDIATAIVLIVAVTLDALVRRRAIAH